MAEGEDAVASALQETFISLQNAGLGDAGVQTLALALKKTSELKAISLGPEGAKALADALIHNTSLQRRSANLRVLFKCSPLSKALGQNVSLQVLYLRYNNIKDQGLLSRIHDALKRNEVASPPRAPVSDLDKEGLAVDPAAWLEAVSAAITQGDAHAWGRAKLMVVGRGAAGKTSTVRSLLGQASRVEHLSTEVADIHRTRAQDWHPLESDHGEFDAQVRYAATQRLVAAARKGQELSASTSGQSTGDEATDRPLSPSGSPKSVGASESPEPLLAPKDVARRFSVSAKEQTLLLQDSAADRNASFTIWDYGGQQVFYALHHIFLTDKGLYLVVFDMREIIGKEQFKDGLSPDEYAKLATQDEAIEFLRFWLNSIKLHAPRSPVLLVGTHKDEVHDLHAVQSVLGNRKVINIHGTLVRPPGSSFFAINNRSPDPHRAAALRAAIAKTAAAQSYVHEQVPLAWLKIHEDLLQSDTPFVTFENVVARGAAYGQSRAAIEKMLAYFHGLGVVVHLGGSEVLKRVVVIDPQWLLDKLARVIADDMHAQSLYRDEGLLAAELMPAFERMHDHAIASRRLLEWLWEDQEVDYLLGFMDANMLLCPWHFDDEDEDKEDDDDDGKKTDAYLISGLLSDAVEDVKTEHFEPGLSCELDFSGFFLPNGVFHRLIAQCAKYAVRPEVTGDDEPMKPALGRRQAMLSFGINDFLLTVDGDVVRICVDKNAERPAMVIKVLVSMLREQAETVFGGLPWDLLLVSPTTQVAVAYAKIVEKREEGRLDARLRGPNRKVAAVSEFEPFFTEKIGALDTDEDGPSVPAFADVPALARGEDTHVFLSHIQSTGGDLADMLRLKLENRGLRVWFDQAHRAVLNQEAMLDGVRRARTYVLILTAGVFASDAVKAELECACRSNKRIVVVHEPDTHRSSYVNFGEYIDATPSFCPGLFNEEESLPVRRKWYTRRTPFSMSFSAAVFDNELADEKEKPSAAQPSAAQHSTAQHSTAQLQQRTMGCVQSMIEKLQDPEAAAQAAAEKAAEKAADKAADKAAQKAAQMVASKMEGKAGKEPEEDEA
ncbi:Leucine-rich repeat serine/threonine-protein kinase 1 [Hondaea fermentalgiana]|uniref:non-specific serine/threonine protein kinase n=1 Tax=Hondaea fermentalgiana TaxID=2315210 RepID=A0A2R5GET0_9STRA|nr:Leucine-rich repeat serine/threonine-protein kinase 1 [Hondaea fermentalgiana]|eukprot:GBG26751.1 Leucine-rich repeat serine/threonine-protein kinase 1 [Hondaea fermentalgiana]